MEKQSFQFPPALQPREAAEAKQNSQLPLALRPRVAAKALGVSERLLWEWTHRGGLPHVKVGRTVLYPVAELQVWLSRQAEAAKGGNDDAG